MRKVWVLDTETKGTGAHVAPLEEAPGKSGPERRRRRRSAEGSGSHQSPPRRRKKRDQERAEASPLPLGHVRKKATGEIGKVQAVDPKAGTAQVLWLRQGRTSTVPLTTISRR